MHVVRTGKRTRRKLITTHQRKHRREVAINILPEDTLLEIFDFYLSDHPVIRLNPWHKLVHVCRKWRNVVFSSPRRLNLQLFCRARTPVRKMLNIWPELPIVVENHGQETWGMDNILAALEQTDRICDLTLIVSRSDLEKALEEMQQPFPLLTNLSLWHFDKSEPPVIPASFLGGSAPLLRSLHLMNIPFPGLPKLLLSATHLVDIMLSKIPYSGHFSPEVLVTCLSALTRLETLGIIFESPRSRAGRTSLHPLPRTLLPFLTKFYFEGVSEYLEDLVARIDAPRLSGMEITFFHQLIFDTPQLAQFICRAAKLKAQKGAYVGFNNSNVRVALPQSRTTSESFDGNLKTLALDISCSHSDWQLSSLAQVCSSSFPQALIHTVEDLEIFEAALLVGSYRVPWQDDLESNQWIELLHPFTAVKDLKLSWNFTQHIAPVLQELVGDRTMEVLSALQTLSIDVPLLRDEPIPSEFPFPSRLVQESIEQFVAARELAGHPITVRRWMRFKC